ncbi:MAG: helix-turn-helix domain-containing protein [Sphingobacteriia bacterium]
MIGLEMEIGKKLKDLVELKRVNKAELARQMNMSEQNLYKIFKKQSIDTALLQAFASHLGVTLSYFFDDAPRAEYRQADDAFEDRVHEGEDQEEYIDRLRKEISYLKELNKLKDDLIRALKRD